MNDEPNGLRPVEDDLVKPDLPWDLAAQKAVENRPRRIPGEYQRVADILKDSPVTTLNNLAELSGLKPEKARQIRSALVRSLGGILKEQTEKSD